MDGSKPIHIEIVLIIGLQVLFYATPELTIYTRGHAKFIYILLHFLKSVLQYIKKNNKEETYRAI